MSQYLFALGNNPALSAEEILVKLKDAQIIELTRDFLILEAVINPQNLLTQLGGTIKIAELISQIDSLDKIDLKKIAHYFLAETDAVQGKYAFGFSQYGLSKKIKTLRALGLELKKILKSSLPSVRFVCNDTMQLSSVAVSKNKLVGKELLIVKGNSIYLAVTQAVQDFESYGKRDFGRPERDAERGMLPPKVAQIMINLSGKKNPAKLLDPFCGLGTIIQEAIFLGFDHILASDKDAQAVSQTERNLKWLRSQGYQHQVTVQKMSVNNLRQYITAHDIDVIVTEPYLGPARELQRKLPKEKLQKIVGELTQLYKQSLDQFCKILKSDGVVVMVWPVFNSGTLSHTLPLDSYIKNSGFKIRPPQILKTNLKTSVTKRQTLIYSRLGQSVAREIVVLDKA